MGGPQNQPGARGKGSIYTYFPAVDTKSFFCVTSILIIPYIEN